MQKRALITGINGQDGAYLAALLLTKGYTVYGLISRGSTIKTENLAYLGIVDEIIFVQADMTDLCSLINAVKMSKPTEVYNLAAMSFVGISWDQPIHTANVNSLGALNLLEALRNHAPMARIYQASTSEMFGLSINSEGVQNEQTPFHPRSPYGVSKVFAHQTMINYRESYGMFCSCGILFNHESPIRGREFVTRKITNAVARISLDLQDTITLGNLDAQRDWGFAGDYVEAMWMMLQHHEPDDFVIATGHTRSIRQFLDAAFESIGVSDWDSYVDIDPRLVRPAEVNVLKGDASKAKKLLGWEPSTSFENWVQEMVSSDIKINSSNSI